MATSSFGRYVVLSCLAYLAQLSDAASVEVRGGGSLMRAEERREHGWPVWDNYFKSLDNLTFVQIGANSEDRMYNYAFMHNWAGFAIDSTENAYQRLQDRYAKMHRVKPLHRTLSEDAHSKVEKMTLASLWENGKKNQSWSNVDILMIDGGETQLLLKGDFPEPKPHFIVFKYHRLGRTTYRHLGTNLEENGYEYVGRDGQDELHELIALKALVKAAENATEVVTKVDETVASPQPFKAEQATDSLVPVSDAALAASKQ